MAALCLRSVFDWNGEGVLRLNGFGAGKEVSGAAERLGRG